MRAPAPFPSGQPRGHRPASAATALVLVILLFALLPLSRQGRETPPLPEEPVRQPLRSVRIDPPPPEETRTEPARERRRESPRPPVEPPLPNIRTAGLALDPLAPPEEFLLRNVPLGSLGEGVDTGEVIRRFTFADLAGGPRVLSVPPVNIPLSLAREGFTRGVVVFAVRVHEDGSVEVLDVVRSSHRDLVEPARRSAERARFEPPEIDGRPVVVHGEWPLVIESY